MNNQFAKIFTHKGNQVVLMKSTVDFMLNILIRPSVMPVAINLSYESESIRDIMFETLNSKAISIIIDNHLKDER